MATAHGGYCSVCHSTYRGTYAVHLSTKKHRRNAAGPVVHRARRRAGFRRQARYWIDHWGDDRVSVKRHRRSPPADGTKKVVKVSQYWRRARSGYRPY